MPYLLATTTEQEHLRSYVESMLERFWAFRESKENFAVAALAVFLGAVATALVSKDWPPQFAQSRPDLDPRNVYCEWLLAEWLPDSPRAMAKETDPPSVGEPSVWVLMADVFWPLKRSVTVLKPSLRVYPKEIERAWLLAQKRGTDALRHEYIVHVLGWLGYVAVVLRTLLA